MEFGKPPTVSESREELIPGLPDDVAVECFLRLPYTAHSAACRVSRSWQSLLQSKRFYTLRRALRYTRSLACLVQQFPPSSPDDPCSKPANGAAPMSNTSSDRHNNDNSLVQLYSVSVFDPGSLSWTRVPPIPDFSNGLPLFCQLASTDGKLLVLGGWHPVTYDPLRSVYLHDFVTGEWRRCADMPGMRTFFAAVGTVDGRVFVAGGHDEYKNALSTAWAYDVARDAWDEMEGMSQERDECEGAILGSGTELWVVSGYKTERQGEFEGSADVYEIGDGGRSRRRRRVEGSWEEGKCPRGGLGLGGAVEAGVRVWVCGVVAAGKAVMVGSEYQGGKQGFYVADGKEEGKLGKLVKVEVPEEFSGFVQSGCCIEVYAVFRLNK